MPSCQNRPMDEKLGGSLKGVKAAFWAFGKLGGSASSPFLGGGSLGTLHSRRHEWRVVGEASRLLGIPSI